MAQNIAFDKHVHQAFAYHRSTYMGHSQFYSCIACMLHICAISIQSQELRHYLDNNIP
uniref:Uncharacterized protein n=1 Tax=Rhizophora mucronata TaxID=61149 RepID=A0A2P2QNS3_RHIMU